MGKDKPVEDKPYVIKWYEYSTRQVMLNVHEYFGRRTFGLGKSFYASVIDDILKTAKDRERFPNGNQQFVDSFAEHTTIPKEIMLSGRQLDYWNAPILTNIKTWERKIDVKINQDDPRYSSHIAELNCMNILAREELFKLLQQTFSVQEVFRAYALDKKCGIAYVITRNTMSHLEEAIKRASVPSITTHSVGAQIIEAKIKDFKPAQLEECVTSVPNTQ